MLCAPVLYYYCNLPLSWGKLTFFCCVGHCAYSLYLILICLKNLYRYFSAIVPLQFLSVNNFFSYRYTWAFWRNFPQSGNSPLYTVYVQYRYVYIHAWIGTVPYNGTMCLVGVFTVAWGTFMSTSEDPVIRSFRVHLRSGEASCRSRGVSCQLPPTLSAGPCVCTVSYHAASVLFFFVP
jgi:hypothetical protein